MFPSVQPIAGSPFAVTPTGRKPLDVQGLGLTVATWNSLTVSFTAPPDDGGSDVVAYRVMWYYGGSSLTYTPEVQTIKMSSSVFGGTFSVVSPGGHVYPYPIPFDIDGPGLALVLMRLPDISSVAVSKNLLADGGASVTWQVTFLHQAQGQSLPSPPLAGPIMVKPSGLLSINGTTLAVCAGGVATDGTYTAPPCLSSDSALATNLATKVVTASPAAGSPNAVSLTLASGTNYTYTIPNLNQTSADHSGFSVLVVATNREGWTSVPWSIDTLKPMGLPDGPVYAEVLPVAGASDSVRVYWSSVSYPYDRASPVTKYVVQYSSDPSWSDPALVHEAIVYGNSSMSIRANDLYARTVESHTLTGLTPGTPYYVQVLCVNAVGRGAPTTAVYADAGASAIVPMAKTASIPQGAVQLTTLPASAFVSVKESASSLKVSFSAPLVVHGSPVTTYLIEWWDTTVPVSPEVVTLSLFGASSGAFRVAYNGSRTDYLPVTISADGLRNALQALPSIRGVQVSKANVTTASYTWSVTFTQDWPSLSNTTVLLQDAGVVPLPGATYLAQVASYRTLSHSLTILH